MQLANEAWQEHREALLRFVLSRGVEPHDAEDIVQDALLKALAPRGGPAEPSKLRAWLFQVVRNAIIDHHRRKQPQLQVPEDLPEVPEIDDRPDLLLACLDPFLARLPDEDASILRLADAGDVPQAAIAARLGLGLSATKSRIQRARAKVLRMYQDCCRVELDQRQRLVSYTDAPCGGSFSGETGASCGGCAAPDAS